MNIQKKIKPKLDELINLMLTVGVQPSELADNIFNNSYDKISYKKEGDFIIGELSFNEEQGSINYDVILRYFYTKDKTLIKIEEDILGEKCLLWERAHDEDTLIKDIINLMRKQYTTEQVTAFVSSLPEHIKERIQKAALEVA